MQFLGWFEQPETLYIAMEFFPEGDLARHIDRPLPQVTVQRILKQILEGLKVSVPNRPVRPALGTAGLT